MFSSDDSQANCLFVVSRDGSSAGATRFNATSGLMVQPVENKNGTFVKALEIVLSVEEKVYISFIVVILRNLSKLFQTTKKALQKDFDEKSYEYIWQVIAAIEANESAPLKRRCKALFVVDGLEFALAIGIPGLQKSNHPD